MPPDAHYKTTTDSFDYSVSKYWLEISSISFPNLALFRAIVMSYFACVFFLVIDQIQLLASCVRFTTECLKKRVFQAKYTKFLKMHYSNKIVNMLINIYFIIWKSLINFNVSIFNVFMIFTGWLFQLKMAACCGSPKMPKKNCSKIRYIYHKNIMRRALYLFLLGTAKN